jgi:hypothetical protein
MSGNQHGHDPLERPARAHEDSDVRATPVAIFLVSLVFLVLGAFLVVAWLFSWFETQEAARYRPMVGVAVEPELPPEPRLQPSPVRDLMEMRATEEETLRNYGWVNRQGGIVRVPVDRAMQLVLERGLPEVPPQQPLSPGQADIGPESPVQQQAVPDAGVQPAPGDVQPARPDEETDGAQTPPQGEAPDGTQGRPEVENL